MVRIVIVPRNPSIDLAISDWFCQSSALVAVERGQQSCPPQAAGKRAAAKGFEHICFQLNVPIRFSPIAR